jgi:hypothetical protein
MDAKILVTLEHLEDTKLISDSLEHFGHCVTKTAIPAQQQSPTEAIEGHLCLSE